MGIISFAYFTKIALGIVTLLSLCIVLVSVFKVGVFSGKLETVWFFRSSKTVLIFSIVEFAACAATAWLGWFVREVGRPPWTVYGLLYPQELVSPVPIDPVVLTAFVIDFHDHRHDRNIWDVPCFYQAFEVY